MGNPAGCYYYRRNRRLRFLPKGNLVNIQDIAALTAIASFIGAIGLWIGSKLFASRADIHKIKHELQVNTMETSLIGRDVSWIKARLTNEN